MTLKRRDTRKTVRAENFQVKFSVSDKSKTMITFFLLHILPYGNRLHEINEFNPINFTEFWQSYFGQNNSSDLPSYPKKQIVGCVGGVEDCDTKILNCLKCDLYWIHSY